jgi:hypothetical protein
MSPDGQDDDLTENKLDDFDLDLTEEELEELEQDLEDDPTCGCTFAFKMLVGTLEEDEDEDDEDDDAYPDCGWYDISKVNPDLTQTLWFTPEAAQRLMDQAKATGITAEQAFGWMLLRAYGRTPE